ncbi:putative subtilisin-like protease [Ophiocordyceps camponoti-saundersi (nom. inval.)]|nr:putative subtilisin-like protease [Ophiocordyceps camponoti-saundersi (nom. inval.)]
MDAARHREYDLYDYYAVHLESFASPELVADELGMLLDGPMSLPDHYILRAPRSSHDQLSLRLQERKRRKRHANHILLARKQEPRMRLHKRIIPPSALARSPAAKSALDTETVKKQDDVMQTLQIHDPIFKEQWHLLNTRQPGHDINVTGLWLEGITGKDATVAIVDDGIDMSSDDLKNNYFAAGSWDFNDKGAEPRPRLSDDKHGTRCAGEVAAARNDVCGVGAAYDARVAGIRILSKPISDADEADAMMYKNQDNQIYSCSWGPRDDGRSMEAPGILIQRAILQGVQKGRAGLGSIFVFASGNGAASDDNCNFDGYTNSIYSITVGAVDRAGHHPYYSELCSAQLVVTYSSGDGDSIHTTDVGTNQCTSSHGGTSAAAPLAAGIFALVMQVRPDLSWRDVQYLAMDTAVPVADKLDSWQTTSIGKKYSHYFGYGKIDSYALVERAKKWTKVKPQAWFFSPWMHIKRDIPEGDDGLTAYFEVTEAMMKKANLGRVEHVTITMNVNHTRRGDLSVDLVSPDNIVSHIATARAHDSHNGGYVDWTFMTVVHWGESGLGKWSLVVRDTKVNQQRGYFVDWRMKLWGEAIDAKAAYLLPMPQSTDDDDHDKTSIAGPVSTSTGGVGGQRPPGRPTMTALPTDHPERPTKPGNKPVDSDVPSSPSFGKSGPVWVYGAFCLIVVFCIGLGVYLWVARRRRMRNKVRDSYEFELIDEEETEAMNGGGIGGGGGGDDDGLGDDGVGVGDGVGGDVGDDTDGEKDPVEGRRGRRTRGGELYDAFAGNSDDDDDDDDDGGGGGGRRGGGGHGQYRDESRDRLVASHEVEQYVIGEESDEEADDVSPSDSKLLGGRGS